jgi:hypothetical protein
MWVELFIYSAIIKLKSSGELSAGHFIGSSV